MSEIDWSKAPAGTTHYQPNINGWQSGWIMAVEGKVFFWHEKWLIDDATLDEAAIPRPSKPQWRGPEDGLPPVGTVCEFALCSREGLYEFMDEWRDGDRLEVIDLRFGESAPVAVVWNPRTYQATALISRHLRPLKSDKERAVEAAMDSVWRAHGKKADKFDLAVIYDAGLLRLPEERS